MSRSPVPARLALAFALAMGGCHKNEPAASAPNVELPGLAIQQVADQIDHHERVALFDVNHRSRYESGHVPGAVWVPEEGVTAAILPADKSTPLVFYCSNAH